MDLSLWVLFGVVALLGVNQLVVRVLRIRTLRTSFWLLQCLNILVGSALIWKGLPDFEDIPVVSWALGLLMFLHVAENTRTKASADLIREKQTRAVRSQEIKEALSSDKELDEGG